MWIKIEEDIFYISNINVQFTIMSHANISLYIDIQKYPEYYDYFSNKYDNWNTFIIINNKFIASNCVIKSMDVIFKTKLHLEILCDVIDTDIVERREEILNQILNEND
jgi:hypothetical protein